MTGSILTIDMKSLRILYAALTVLMVFFAFGTVLAVVMTPATLGSGGIGLHGSVDKQTAAPALRTVAGDIPYKIESGDVRVTVRVPARDHDTRRVIAGGFLVMIALAWLGLIALRGVVRSARDGEPFDARNVTRLRVVGGAIIAVPVLVAVLNRMLEASFDSQAVHAEVARVDAAPMALIGLGVLALAEVFRQGVALREMEEATI
jgi:hypothetical protein